MARDLMKDFAIGTVSTGYNGSATSVVMTTGHGARFSTGYALWYNSTDYVNPSDPVTPDPNREWVQITTIATDTLTVTRGVLGTSGTTKNTANKTYWLVQTPPADWFNRQVVQRAYVSKSADYTLVASSATAIGDDVVDFDCSGAARTATLPTAVGCTGQEFTITKTDSGTNALIYTGTSSQTIGMGRTTDWLLTQNSTVTLRSDGANWQIRDIRREPLIATPAADTLTAATITTTPTAFATTFTLPANYFTTGRRIRVTYEVEAVGSSAAVSSIHQWRTATPTSLYAQNATSAIAPNSSTRSYQMQFTLTGTAAPGASVALICGVSEDKAAGTNATNSIAQGVLVPTNAAITMAPWTTFNTNTASNTERIVSMAVEYLN